MEMAAITSSYESFSKMAQIAKVVYTKSPWRTLVVFALEVRMPIYSEAMQ